MSGSRLIFHACNSLIYSCDLQQRDFTVNAMALAVHASDADLIDPLGGQADLEVALPAHVLGGGI